MIFLGKTCTGVFGQKVAQNMFFEFYNKLMQLIFLIFCMKFQKHKGWKLDKTYFDKIVVLEFLGQKNPGMGQKLVLLSFLGNGNMTCFKIFVWIHQHKIALNNWFFFFFFFFLRIILFWVFGLNHQYWKMGYSRATKTIFLKNAYSKKICSL